MKIGACDFRMNLNWSAREIENIEHVTLLVAV